MKKKLALALVFVMGLSFTACGKTTVSDSTNEAVSGGVQSTDTNEDKESSGKSDKTTITFINGFTGGDGEYMTKIVDGFNESQSDYYIEQLQDADHYTKFKSGDFDMLIIHADWISTYHAMGLLREVSDIYDMAGISFENDFHDITKTYAKYDDGVFAFPLDLYAETTFYNKEYTDEAPKDYNDMIELRDKLDSENSGIYPYGLPLTGDQQWAWMTALGQCGVNWVEDEHIKLDTEEACDAFMKIHDMIYKDHLSPAGLGADDHFNTFISQSETAANVKTVVSMTGPWKYTVAKEVLGDNLGIGTVPQIYGDKKCVPADRSVYRLQISFFDCC